jgi:hypothetical protein
METHSADIEAVTLSEILDLATWNRQRTDEELQNFIITHNNNLPDDIDIE